MKIALSCADSLGFWFAANKERYNDTHNMDITKRAILYRGDDYREENGIEYIDIEGYLQQLA